MKVERESNEQNVKRERGQKANNVKIKTVFCSGGGEGGGTHWAQLPPSGPKPNPVTHTSNLPRWAHLQVTCQLIKAVCGPERSTWNFFVLCCRRSFLKCLFCSCEKRFWNKYMPINTKYEYVFVYMYRISLVYTYINIYMYIYSLLCFKMVVFSLSLSFSFIYSLTKRSFKGFLLYITGGWKDTGPIGSVSPLSALSFK